MSTEKQKIDLIENNILGVSVDNLPAQTKEIKSVKVKELVAIHSIKNLYSSSLGKVLKGYNIIEKKNLEKWLTKSGIRLADPEEVAKEYGL
jgi:hypothetical protein